MDAAGQLTLHLLAEHLQIDGLLIVVIHRGDNGRNDALEFYVFHVNRLLFCFLCVHF